MSPVPIGRGLPLLGHRHRNIGLGQVATHASAPGLVHATYQRVRPSRRPPRARFL